MDPISLGIAMIMGLWTFDNDEKQREIIKEQQQYIEQMDATMFRLIGSHSAVSARDSVNDEILEQKIESLENEINRLDDKIDIMTDPARMVE